MTATRTKRILSIQPVRDGGGSETALIRMIRRLRAGGWECHVALPAPARLADEYAAAGATLHVVPMRRLTTSEGAGHWVALAAGWPVSVARLARLARSVDADVIHSNSLHSWYGWAVARLVRRPHVWHAREVVIQSRAALRVERSLARRFATVVIAVSQAVAEQLDPANVEVVFDEPDPAEFSPGRAGAFRRREGIPDEVPLVGAASRIDVWKGIDVLLDAVGELRCVRPDVEVVVAGAPVGGKDEYAASLAARARALGVRWLGQRDDMPELLADLDVFVQASTEPEPFGLGIVEALASGTPVVATAGGGPLEILGGAPEAGRLVPFSDPAALARAILELLPEGPSSDAGRRRRPLLRTAPAPRFVELFDSVVARQARER